MCNLNSQPLEKHSFTGYKGVLRHKKTGKFYSPYTGVLYKVGQVPIVRKAHTLPQSKKGDWRPHGAAFLNHLIVPRSKASRKEILHANRHNSVLNEGFRRNMIGCTAVFKKLKDCISHFEGKYGWFERPSYELWFVKFKLEGDLYEGDYSGHLPVIAGDHIAAITPVANWKAFLHKPLWY